MFSILVYYGFTYLLVSDVIFTIDRGRPTENVVKRSYGILSMVNDT